MKPADLVDLTPVRARDLLVRCFLEAQRETFARQRRHLGLGDDDERLRTNVVGAVRAVFRELGLDFEKPTANGLSRVMEVLGARAASWGTPEDIIAHHRAQMTRVVDAVKD